jgi:dTDP-D-glucose 4,6-dehydratase
MLGLDATKVRTPLGWGASWDLTQTLERSVEWYRTWESKRDVRPIMTRQIADFAAATGK